jgi:hypothetical protein
MGGGVYEKKLFFSKKVHMGALDDVAKNIKLIICD